MGLLLKLHYCICCCAISATGDERCHIKLFNDYTASIDVNGKCKRKHITPFLHVKVYKPVL